MNRARCDDKKVVKLSMHRMHNGEVCNLIFRIFDMSLQRSSTIVVHGKAEAIIGFVHMFLIHYAFISLLFAVFVELQVPREVWTFALLARRIYSCCCYPQNTFIETQRLRYYYLEIIWFVALHFLSRFFFPSNEGIVVVRFAFDGKYK